MTAPRSDLAARLRERIPGMLDRYRGLLAEARSPLVDDEAVWAELEVQVRHIIDDCARTLCHTPARPGAGELPSAVEMPSAVEIAGRRGAKGIHPKSSVRASIVLFELVVSEVAELVAGQPDGMRCLAGAAVFLNDAVGTRLEQGAIGYDTFLRNQVREAIDSDRRHVARELHDRVGNNVSLAMRQLELLARQPVLAGRRRPAGVPAPGAPPGSADDRSQDELVLHLSCQLEETRKVLSEALEELRDQITGLRRSRANGALRAALTAYAGSVRAREPEVSVVVTGVESWAPADTLDEVFLIVREALRNVHAHAGARHAAVTIDFSPHELWAVVHDDGAGFDRGLLALGSGSGLACMTERAQALRGRLSIHSTPGQGTRVTLWAPIQENA